MKPCEVLDLVTAILRSVNMPQESTLGVHFKRTFPGLIHRATRESPIDSDYKGLR